MAIEQASRRELTVIQAARAFAAIAVLLHHVNVLWAAPGYFGHAMSRLFQPGDSGVEVFFVISGFVIAMVHETDLGKPQRVGGYLWKRFRRIYPPLWAAIVLVILLLCVGIKNKHLGPHNPLDILGGFLATPAQREPFLAVEWTLRHEIVFYCLFGLAIINPKIGVPIGLVWFGCSIAGAFITVGSGDVLFSPYHLLFGMGIACYAASRLPQFSSFKWPSMIIGATAFIAIWVVDAIDPDHARAGVRVIGLGVGTMYILCSAVYLERTTHLKVPLFIRYLGDASYSIYLVHFLAVSALAKFAVVAAARDQIPEWILFVAVSAGGILFGLVFYHAVERPLLRLLPRAIKARS